MIQPVFTPPNKAHLGRFSKAVTNLLGDDVSLPHMDTNGVQRGWQEQVLALTVEGLTLGTTSHG